MIKAITLIMLVGLAPTLLANGLEVDTQSREAVRNFFNAVYQASENIPSGWDGHIEQCQAGKLSADYLAAIALRVNFFRAMAGVPAAITFNEEYNRKAQQAALMMSANNTLSHQPPSSWLCYTEEGAQAAENSNLSLGSMGPQSITGLMEDGGNNNAAVGHRRWTLFPPTEVMGSGSVAGTELLLATTALWVFDDSINNPRPATREAFVSWPPSGFVPYPLVFPRWSFSYPQADFSLARVSMQQQGTPIQVTLEPLNNPGMGDNTIVWVPDITLTTPPTTDISYTVKITKVLIDGKSQDFEYTVTVINPMILGTDSIFPMITGDEQLMVNQNHTYTFNLVPDTSSYQLSQAHRQTVTQVADAENGLEPLVATVSDYPVIATDIKAGGSASFHLAHPAPPSEQILRWNQTLLVNEASELHFSSRLGLSSPAQIAKVQVSIDNGQSWQTVFTQPGTQSGFTSSLGEEQFNQKTISLAEFTGQAIQVRFSYAYTCCDNFYPQTESGIGWYIDNIVFTDTEELTEPTITNLGTERTFIFNPPQVGDYALQIRAMLYNQYPLEWGPTKLVTAQQGTTTENQPPDSTSLPSLGSATVVNSTTPAINTNFSGGIAVNHGIFQEQVASHSTDSVEIRGEIAVESQHVEQSANIIVVVIYQFPSLFDSIPLFFMINTASQVIPWDMNMATLIPFQSEVTLAAKQPVLIYQGQLPAGNLSFYWGYQLKDGTLVYNSKPIMATVTE
ncbi:MAG: CAP domain-containing protein [Thioploca sp.]|nr:CAP domain-containing protein [Thioploca sp.]